MEDHLNIVQDMKVLIRKDKLDLVKWLEKHH
jgi:hypothetical protein